MNINTKQDALDFISNMIEDLKLVDCRVGLAGSFARGTQDIDSDIDIVLDCEDNFDETFIRDYIESNISNRPCDLILLNLLLKDKMFLLSKGETEESLGETFYDVFNKTTEWIGDRVE